MKKSIEKVKSKGILKDNGNCVKSNWKEICECNKDTAYLVGKLVGVCVLQTVPTVCRWQLENKTPMRITGQNKFKHGPQKLFLQRS